MARFHHFRGVIVGFVVLAAAWSARGDVQFPSGTQDFESMTVGADINTLIPWFTVNTSVPTSNFTVVAADDVLGTQTTRGTSTRWLRVTDIDAGAVQNRFYSGTIVMPDTPRNYSWTFYVNIENTPPGGADTKPKLTIQHNTTTGFSNAWGVQFTSAGADLIVLATGGSPGATALYSLSSPTGIGDWVKIELSVDFIHSTVSASVNDGSPVSRLINLAPTADAKTFRFCYRGEDLGNDVTMLIDDVSLEVGPKIPTVGTWGVAALGLLVITAGTVLMLQRRRVAAV